MFVLPLSTHSLIGWIPKVSLICCLLIPFLFCQLLYLVLSSHFLPTLVFQISALVSSEYVIIGRTVALYMFFILFRRSYTSQSNNSFNYPHETLVLHSKPNFPPLLCICPRFIVYVSHPCHPMSKYSRPFSTFVFLWLLQSTFFSFNS